MEKKHMERLFSAGRLARFYHAAGQDASEAAALYAGNILLSESLYPSLAVAEVVLRNAVHRQLSYLFQTPDWYQVLSQREPALVGLQSSLTKAEEYILDRGETLSADKVVAELPFGFWSSLFNAAYELVLWKQLRLAFPHLPKQDRQRSTVSVAINAVRHLRNRVYHNEPVCWKLRTLEQQHAQTIQLIGWIEPQVVAWLQPLDRFTAVLQTEQQRRARYQAKPSGQAPQ
ncbi:hypothetical protein [Hymenobacter latericus]|uniref:hypothetical protein n=1 Tax=Hymenobacter sp. YIM 151858-1 TaxID=2987688 RepID=UPI00222697C7|nr:hypothetical protein [Hymenobacter sp. YIM 151858-1]UYZ60205.1 hypothetical protein OIS50_05245 [Hymenobacter sp. YIM 151858-1]